MVSTCNIRPQRPHAVSTEAPGLPFEKRELRGWPGIVVPQPRPGVPQPRPGVPQPAPHLQAHPFRGEPAAGESGRVRLNAAVGKVRRTGGRGQMAVSGKEW